MLEVSLHAPDISCGHCKQTIERGLASQQGVAAVEVDVEKKLVHIRYEENVTDVTILGSELAEIGYPVS